MKPGSLFLTTLVACTLTASLFAYPLDGYEETGIRRVEGARLANQGLAPGGFQPPGAQLPTSAVDLRLRDYPELELPAADPELSARIVAMLGEDADSYGVTVLDLTDPTAPVYAEHRGDYRQNVGSIGKLIGALGLFQALADAWPDDTTKRKEILKNTVITADDFAHSDHHTVRFFDVENKTLDRRTIQDGDQGSLWEYLDWMLSVSSNSAAAMVMRDAMLLRQFGQSYPVAEDTIRAFFSDTPASDLTALYKATFWEPVTRNGLDLHQIRQGSFFTRQGKQNVNGGGNSYATARSLMQLLVNMEKGQLVDDWSSLQIKRLIYMTEHRIRYASSPALREAAVYFKSGSLYSCKEEAGFTCGKYKGNKVNYMNSVAIVEQEVDGKRLHYIVVVISNVLRKNSAEAHQALGTAMHELIMERNGVE